MALNTDKLAQDAAKATATPVAKRSRQATEQTRESADAVAAVNPEDKNINVRSKDLALVANLGNPAKKDTVGKEGDEKHNVRSSIIGYKVKNVSETPIEFAEFGLGADANVNRLSHGADPKQVFIAPGEEANLTSYELALVLATVEFNGLMEGGEHAASGVYSAPDANAGGTEDKGANRMKFHVKIKDGSIRQLPYIDVLSAEWGADPATGRSRVVSKTINEGFEKFAPLAETNRQRRGSAGRTSTPSAPKRNLQAAEFLNAAIAGNKK